MPEAAQFAIEFLVGGGVLVTLGKLLFDTGKVIQRIDMLEGGVRDRLEPAMNDVRDKVIILWQDRIAPARSPRALNERGKAILEQTTIQAFADDHYETILSQVRDGNPENAYQAEQLTVAAVNAIDVNQPTRLNLEQGAFAAGATLDELFFVAAIYLRDRVLRDLGLEFEGPVAKGSKE